MWRKWKVSGVDPGPNSTAPWRISIRLLFPCPCKACLGLQLLPDLFLSRPSLLRMSVQNGPSRVLQLHPGP